MDLMPPKKNFVSPITGNATQHTIFEIVLLLIVAGVFYKFVIMPKQDEVGLLKDRHAELSETFSTLEDNERKLDKAIADMKSHQSELKDLDEALPLESRVTKLYIALENLTQSSGMSVGDINVAFKNEASQAGNRTVLKDKFGVERSLQKLTTNLDVTGTMEQFQALLGKLEESGRLMNISSVEIGSAQDSLLNFRINLDAYYYE